MEAYCIKCKEKREMQDPVPDYTSSGTPMTRGICPVCGTKLAKFGRTPEHDTIEKPEKAKPAAKRNKRMIKG